MPDTLLRFVHISDTHISHDPDYALDWPPYHPRERAEALVQEINNLPFTPDFVLHTGDVVYHPNPDAYDVAREILSRINYPVYYLAGNHDDSEMLQRILLQNQEIWPDYHYAFEDKGAQVVCLDSTGPAEPPRGFVSADQLAWLAGICEADDQRPLVVAVHHNVLPSGIPWLDNYMSLTNGEALHQTLLPARDRLRGVFFGHVHQNLQMMRDGILYTSVLSSWYQIHAWPGQEETIFEEGAEPGFNVVTITPQQTLIRHHRFPL